jgi:hypothetical protein
MITCDKKHRRSPFDIVGHNVSHLPTLPASVPRGAVIFCRDQALVSVGRCSYARGVNMSYKIFGGWPTAATRVRQAFFWG